MTDQKKTKTNRKANSSVGNEKGVNCLFLMGLAAFKTYSTVLYSTELSLHSGSGGPWIVSDVSAVFLHHS